MGILNLLVVSAAGICSVRAIQRLNSIVKRIRVPPATTLNRIANERGDRYADTFVIELPKRVAYSNIPIGVEDFTKSFFNSLVFCSFEKVSLLAGYGGELRQVKCEFCF